jgi:hypothetical protein
MPTVLASNLRKLTLRIIFGATSSEKKRVHCHQSTVCLQKKLTEIVKLLIYIREVHGSNPAWDTDYHNMFRDISYFL